MPTIDQTGFGLDNATWRAATEAWIGLWALLLVCLVPAFIFLSRGGWGWFELAASLFASIVSEVLARLIAETHGSYAAGTVAELLRMLAFASFCAQHERGVLGWSILDPLPEDEESLPPAAVGGRSETYADPSWPVSQPSRFSLRRSDGCRVCRWRNIIRFMCATLIETMLVIATVWMAASSSRTGTFSHPADTFTGSDRHTAFGGLFGSVSGGLVVAAKILYLVATCLIAALDLAIVLLVARCMVQHHRSRPQAKQPYALWLMVIASPLLLADAAWNIWAIVFTPAPITIYALTWGNLPAWLVGALLIASAIPEKCQGSLGQGARDINVGTMQAWELDQEHSSLHNPDPDGRLLTRSSAHLSSHDEDGRILRLQPTANGRSDDSARHLGGQDIEKYEYVA